MTAKILTGTYSAGYTLSNSFNSLTLTATAEVSGAGGAAYSDAGGVGLTSNFAAPVNNSASLIAGGAGHFGQTVGGMTASGPGGAGGDAVDLGAGTDTFVNSGSIAGGAGGAGAHGFGGGGGGAGGIGISLGAGGEVDSRVRIAGGAGGAGGEGTYGGAGGAGGVGLDFAAGGQVTNTASIQGGAGGAGGARTTTITGKGSAGNGGAGAAGVILTQRGTVDNFKGGFILGGAGGAAGAGGTAQAGKGGYGVVLAAGGAVLNYYEIHGGDGGYKSFGGIAVDMRASGTITNRGDIFGGQSGAQGIGGWGVRLVGGGSVYNAGFIDGGYDQQNGGNGLVLYAGATLTNLGFIYGGGSSTIGSPGAGVVLTSGAIYNGNFIRGGAVAGGHDGAGVLIDAGTLTNGGASHPAAFIYGETGVNAASTSAVTVINRGTIGGYLWSVELYIPSDRLIVQAGAVFEGPVKGGGGTLELAGGADTITNMGGATVSVSGTTAITMSKFGAYVVDAAASLAFTGTNTLNAGDSLVDKGALSLAAGASLTIGDGATAEVQGSVTNAGGITLASTSAHTDLRVLAGGATLSGHGTVTLTGPKSRIWGTTASATLTNVDNHITGSGWLGLSQMTLVNEFYGVIEAVGKQGLVVDTKGRTVVNAGVFDAGSVMTLRDTTFDQSGGGVVRASIGGRLLLDDVVIIGGYIGQGTAGSVINVNASGGEFNGSTSKVELIGAIGVLGGVSLTLDGAMQNDEKLNLHGGAKVSKLIVGPDGATLSGGGQVNLSASVNNIVVGAASGDVLTNVDNRIAGGGNIGDGSMVLVNQGKGQIVGNTAATLTLDTGAHTITNAGTIDSVSTGQVIVKSAVNNNGVIFAAAGTLTLDGAITGTGSGQIKKGVLNIAASFGETVTFVTGATGQLRLTDWKDFTGAVKGLSTTGTNTIDLAAFTKSGTTAKYSGTTASGILTVSNGTQTAKIHLTGNYLGHTFTVANDGHGGVLVKDPLTSVTNAAPLAQALAGFQHDPPPHLATATAYRLPRFPTLHAQA